MNSGYVNALLTPRRPNNTRTEGAINRNSASQCFSPLPDMSILVVPVCAIAEIEAVAVTVTVVLPVAVPLVAIHAAVIPVAVLWTNATAEVVNPSFLFSHQTQESLEDPLFWSALCPFLTISVCVEDKLSPADPAIACRGDNPAVLGDLLKSRGYFRLSAAEMGIHPSITDALALGARRLVAHGFNASFLMIYDESWKVGNTISSFLCPASGNVAIGDWYVFHVDPSVEDGYTPGPPHRDRPTADLSSFRSTGGASGALGGAPLYCSVWLALTDANTDNSCLYVLPSPDDPGYYVGGDSLPPVSCLQAIVSQPLPSGR